MKGKIFMGAAALIAAATLSSPSWAEVQLTEDQLDSVSAGQELGEFYSVWSMPVEYPNSVDGFAYWAPYFSPETQGSVIYFAPLTQ